jgi:hypothetical protein
MINFLMKNDVRAQEPNGGTGHGDDVPRMLKYRNLYRPRV